MELGSHEGAEIAMPISATFNAPVIRNSNTEVEEEEQQIRQIKGKKNVRYRECLKNHAAAMGGNATDGCGEFMPSGEEGSLEALKCCACGCHRNFHRREVEGEGGGGGGVSSSCHCFHVRRDLKRPGVLFSPPPDSVDPFAFPSTNLLPRPHTVMSFGTGPSASDLHEEATFLTRPAVKRFRTKFTQEQKERMRELADKIGWKIQKHDELLVQQFCQEMGIKRRVLKVWMHNNKHTLGKKLD